MPEPGGKGKGDGKGEKKKGEGQELGDIEKLLGRNEGFGTKEGRGTLKVTSSLTGMVGLQEQTKQGFKELLNIKESHKVDAGDAIDSDELTSFLTEDLDTLFQEEKIEHTKKSKIMILLDASGSMNDYLMCGKTRKDGVCRVREEYYRAIE